MDENDWQPLDTAPEDGTYILLWSGTWRHPFVGHRSHNLNMAYIDVPTPIASEVEVFAAYWQPLPAYRIKEGLLKILNGKTNPEADNGQS